jgi:hypothetical protein
VPDLRCGAWVPSAIARFVGRRVNLIDMRVTRFDHDEGARRVRRAAAGPGQGWFSRWPGGGLVTAAALAALSIVVVVASGLVIGRRLAVRSVSPNDFSALTTDFHQLKELNAQVGVAIKPVGSDQDPVVLGDLQTGKAWSTMKVPLAIAALHEKQSPTVTDTMVAAITESDNAAAEQIWASLGDPDTAAHKVEAVLRQAGDPTRVESTKVRPEFTAFGQSDWALANQVRFISYAACQDSDEPILNLMGQIEPGQRWGLGTIAETRFKGGWGPSLTGQYLVRQMGVLTTPSGQAAVAIAAQPASGTFNDGTQVLTKISAWLTQHLGMLPAGECDHA